MSADGGSQPAGFSGSSSPWRTPGPSSSPPPNSLPVCPPLVGKGRRRRRHSGSHSLHDSGWDGGDWIGFYL